MIRQRGRDDDVRGVEDAAREIVCDDRVVAELQVRTVFLRSGAERNDDDRVGAEDGGRFRPRERREADPLGRLLRHNDAGRRGRGRKDRDQTQHAHIGFSADQSSKV